MNIGTGVGLQDSRN